MEQQLRGDTGQRGVGTETEVLLGGECGVPGLSAG